MRAKTLRHVRRGWRRFLRHFSARQTHFLYHQAYTACLDEVPFDPSRGEKILSFLVDEGLVDREDIWAPRRPAVRSLLRVHSADYIASIGRPSTTERIFGARIEDGAVERVIESQRIAVGGTILATRLALQGPSVAVHVGGGFHHALRDAGMGFCVFNDIAVAVTRLRAKGFSDPILVVDLDLHDGNGTRTIFASDPSVHTFSVHNEDWGDTDAVASTSIALGPDVGDEVYLGTLLKTLPDVVSQVKPGLVIYLAGTDPAEDDPLGNWRISSDGMLRRDHLVIELIRRHRRRTPLVVLLGGGYGTATWRYSARFFSWLINGRVVEPPSSAELTLRRFRRIRHSLDPASLTAEPGDYSWKLEEEDLVGILPGAPQRTRFLSHFSSHGVELLLERFGLLDQLRLRGFRHPMVEIDLKSTTGDTLRVFSDPDRQELLMELRVKRDQRVISGCEVLVVEWLLLQNPRAHFGPYRRPLPGQKHPGLGLLREVFSWLVVLAEMLDLDGVFWLPSSYHVAVQSRGVRYLHPEHAALAQVLGKLLEGLTLADASKAVEAGRVVNSATGEPLEWRGCPMVLPVSDDMRERVTGEAYERKVEEEKERLDLTLQETDNAS
ncbi:MAG: histone deacetylase [Acidobacteriota bacterium]